MKKYFKTKTKKLKLPVFFPDATRAVVKTIDSTDILKTKTPGILVNTFHLYQGLGKQIIKKHGSIRQFMAWPGGVISDSGGFQVMSLAKNNQKKGRITDEGVTFQFQKKNKIFFTPEKSIQFQVVLKPDMLVVLDDFTPPQADYQTAKETVERTILWAKKSKKEFEKQLKQRQISDQARPYLLAVVQGGKYQDLRRYCTEKLVEIGFDGLGFGGWPILEDGGFDYDSARTIAQFSPKDYFLYGLGIGKPEEIVGCVKIGFNIFDCVLPTRDARHKRLYVYKADSIVEIDPSQEKFYSFYTPDKQKHYQDNQPVSYACDCLLCTHYSRAYLAHLFRIKEMTALRLSTIHNLRFYSLLMEKIQEKLRLTK
ncbi:tRNA-guanine transglycosylase [Patescibacteria group bacterium]